MRLALRYVIQNQRSIPLANAVVDVYLTTTTTPVVTMWTQPVGGIAISRLISDDTGTIRGWFDAPIVIDLKVSDNTHTAHQIDNLIPLAWTPWTVVGFSVQAIGGTGPAGPAGPPGAAGATGATGSSGGSYRFVQGVPATIWSVSHNLGYRPNVQAFDSRPEPVIGDVAHIDANNLTITFAFAISGEAELS